MTPAGCYGRWSAGCSDNAICELYGSHPPAPIGFELVEDMGAELIFRASAEVLESSGILRGRPLPGKPGGPPRVMRWFSNAPRERFRIELPAEGETGYFVQTSRQIAARIEERQTEALATCTDAFDWVWERIRLAAPRR